MTVCSFWLQGRCRYGDKCWNEHPRGSSAGGRGGGSGEYNSRPPQHSNRGGGGGGGGFGNRVWVNPAQTSGGNYVQPSSFSQSQRGEDWGRGGGRGSQVKSSNFSFAASSQNQNRFAALSPQSSFDQSRIGREEDENEKHLETIQKDMEIWETSGQWVLSCYSVLKATISGFTELSPEELRLEYYTTKASGDLQGYANAVNQLASRWRSRVQELRAMAGPTRAAMLTELNNPAPQAASGGFGSTPVTGFGSSAPTGFGIGFGGPAPVQNTASASNFSFAASSTGGFGSASTQLAPTGFGSASSATTLSAAGFSFAAPAANRDSAATAGFGASTTSSFGASTTSSFGASTTSSFGASTTSSFGAPISASGFSFASKAASGAEGFVGAGFGSAAPIGVSGFGQASSGFGSMSSGTAVTGGVADSLFTPQSELTAEELKEFEGKRFTLGQIPLRPPPAGMLVV